jgi:low affinity Fe/Cu permease
VIYSSSAFSRFAKWTARATGHPAAFMAAALIVVVWGVTGPVFKFSDTWQLVINTGTTIVTFLMVFLIQNTQNRDSHAVQLKLDELIRAVNGAHTMPYSTSKALKKQTSSGFACAMKSSRALRAKGCVVGNWIPAPRKSGRIRSHGFLNASGSYVSLFGNSKKATRKIHESEAISGAVRAAAPKNFRL